MADTQLCLVDVICCQVQQQDLILTSLTTPLTPTPRDTQSTRHIETLTLKHTDCSAEKMSSVQF